MNFEVIINVLLAMVFQFTGLFKYTLPTFSSSLALLQVCSECKYSHKTSVTVYTYIWLKSTQSFHSGIFWTAFVWILGWNSLLKMTIIKSHCTHHSTLTALFQYKFSIQKHLMTPAFNPWLHVLTLKKHLHRMQCNMTLYCTTMLSAASALHIVSLLSASFHTVIH